jgi:hypothetical protein
MYWLSRAKKKDPHLRWALPDRIFFGHGACHILAGAYLSDPPLQGFIAEQVVPAEGYAGSHLYITDGVIAFDFHGYTVRPRLIEHHRKGWSKRYPGWTCRIQPVDFDPLDASALNRHRMLGPQQYLHDALERARRFIRRIDHEKAATQAATLASVEKRLSVDWPPNACQTGT